MLLMLSILFEEKHIEIMRPYGFRPLNELPSETAPLDPIEERRVRQHKYYTLCIERKTELLKRKKETREKKKAVPVEMNSQIGKLTLTLITLMICSYDLV